MTKRVTLKDIAQATGVHVSTVSRALDPNQRTALTPEVVARIRETAERMGYRPNRLASGLRTQRTMTVGLILPDITNTLFPPIVRGVEAALEPLGYASIIVNTDNDAARERTLVDVLLDRGVDGIVDAAPRRTAPAIAAAAARGLPVVTVNRSIEGAGIPAVVPDDTGGIRQMLDHLHAAGHRRIAHIAGPETLSTGALRRAAFETAAATLGLSAAPVCAASRFDEAEGRRCTEALLDGARGFTALLCANDRLAIGALAALSVRGLRCPEDMSVTGFNDAPFLDLVPPGLTTIRVSTFEIGRLGADLLIKRMTDPTAAIPATTVFPVTLISRGSVARPPAP